MPKCETCGTELIDRCPLCWAPQCCPECCKKTAAHEDEARIFDENVERNRDD